VDPAPSERNLPSRLGDFAIAGVLGEGGSGIVYEATWGHRRVALKVLRDELLATARERERFLAEAALLQAVDHPGVVKVLGTGTLPDGRPYLAMEHLDGESLARRIARGPLELAGALALFHQLASAVAALHQRNLVHRDIKPENILVTGGHAVLLDFGIAKPEFAPASTTTQEGSVRGTPAYMAPERFFGAPATVATDVYELAVVLYMMLVGRLPWANVDDPSARLNPPRPSELGRALPAAVETVLAGALSTRAEVRPRSIDELAALVRAAADSNDPRPRVTAELGTRPVSQEATTTSSRRSRTWLAIPIAVVIAGGAVAMWPRSHATTASVPTSDPWGDHPAVATPASTPTTPAAPIHRDLVAHAVDVPAALAAQLDLHSADADVAFVASGAKLRASAAMMLAAKSSPELAQLNTACGLDVLASVDQLVVTGTIDGLSLAWEASARGHFTGDAAEHCIAGLLGGDATNERDGAATRITGGGRTVWVSHPDATTIYATTRADIDHVGHTRDPSVRRSSLAKLIGIVDLKATFWMVGAPPSAAGELFPGVPPPQSLYISGTITAAIDVRAGLRFADAENAVAASRVMRTKLDELAADPTGRGILGDSRVGVAGNDATFALSIHDAFAAITLQSLFKYLAQ
jgi:serine/threonine protein kinase